jgi:hypothetical protein
MCWLSLKDVPGSGTSAYDEVNTTPKWLRVFNRHDSRQEQALHRSGLQNQAIN